MKLVENKFWPILELNYKKYHIQRCLKINSEEEEKVDNDVLNSSFYT
jgi:hypothetical protein